MRSSTTSREMAAAKAFVFDGHVPSFSMLQCRMHGSRVRVVDQRVGEGEARYEEMSSRPRSPHPRFLGVRRDRAAKEVARENE